MRRFSLILVLVQGQISFLYVIQGEKRMKWSFAVPSAHRIPLLRTERRRDFQFRKGIPDFVPAKELIWPIITPISYLKNVFSVQMLLF